MEEEAVGRVLYQALRDLLTSREDALLALLLLGYQHEDAGALLSLTKHQVHRTHQSIQRGGLDRAGRGASIAIGASAGCQDGRRGALGVSRAVRHAVRTCKPSWRGS